MNKFVLNLITEWRRLELPTAGETVVVAVSGGADSLSLLLALDHLHTLKKLDVRIVAAHFNHKLRGRESDRDEEFVKRMASERGVELSVGYGSISSKGNLEQNARVARYDFLADTAENVNSRYVLTAHTMSDQAETFLLNLIRGSGIGGLSGMRPVRSIREVAAEPDSKEERVKAPAGAAGPSAPLLPFMPIYLVRPLLRWANRSDTENFCRQSDVEFRYDTMNEDMSFKRVRVRKMLLPMLKEFNPNIIETLAQTAELMQNTADAERASSLRSTDVDTSEAELAVQQLKDLETPLLHQTLRTWLKRVRGSLRSIDLKHIEAIERLIRSTKSGRTVELPGFGLVRKQKGLISFKNIKVDN